MLVLLIKWVIQGYWLDIQGIWDLRHARCVVSRARAAAFRYFGTRTHCIMESYFCTYYNQRTSWNLVPRISAHSVVSYSLDQSHQTPKFWHEPQKRSILRLYKSGGDQVSRIIYYKIGIINRKDEINCTMLGRIYSPNIKQLSELVNVSTSQEIFNKFPSPIP